MKNQNFDQTKLDQALGSIARLSNVLADWLEMQFVMIRVFIVLMIVVPIFGCVFLVALWFFGDALLKAL